MNERDHAFLWLSALITGLGIVALAVLPAIGDLTVRNHHTRLVRPTRRPLAPGLDVRPPARDQSGPMDVSFDAAGDRVRMIVSFGGRRFWAAMAPEDADRIADLAHAAAAQADANRLDEAGRELLADAALAVNGQ